MAGTGNFTSITFSSIWEWCTQFGRRRKNGEHETAIARGTQGGGNLEIERNDRKVHEELWIFPDSVLQSSLNLWQIQRLEVSLGVKLIVRGNLRASWIVIYWTKDSHQIESRFSNWAIIYSDLECTERIYEFKLRRIEFYKAKWHKYIIYLGGQVFMSWSLSGWLNAESGRQNKKLKYLLSVPLCTLE